MDSEPFGSHLNSPNRLLASTKIVNPIEDTIEDLRSLHRVKATHRDPSSSAPVLPKNPDPQDRKAWPRPGAIRNVGKRPRTAPGPRHPRGLRVVKNPDPFQAKVTQLCVRWKTKSISREGLPCWPCGSRATLHHRRWGPRTLTVDKRTPQWESRSKDAAGPLEGGLSESGEGIKPMQRLVMTPLQLHSATAALCRSSPRCEDPCESSFTAT